MKTIYSTIVSICLFNTINAQTYNWSMALGTPQDEHIAAVTHDNVGGIYVGGWFSDSLDIDPSSNSNYLISNTTSQYPLDGLISKYDNNGNFIWGFNIGSTSAQPNSSTSISDILADNSNNIYVCGSYSGTVDFDPSSNNFNLTSAFAGAQPFIAKYSSAGNLIWAKHILSSTFGDNRGTNLALDNAGNILFVGSFQGTIDLNPSSSGTYLVSAFSYSHMFLTKLDSNGNFIMGFNISNTIPDDIICDSNNDILITGSLWFTSADFDPGSGTATLIPSGQRDIFVAKYTSAGNYAWAINMGGSGADDGKDIAVTSTNQVIISGEFSGVAHMDPGNYNTTISAVGYGDVFMASYSSSGNYLWSFALGNSGDDWSMGLQVDNNDNIYLCAQIVFTTDIDPSPSGVVNYNSITSTGNNIPIIKYSSTGAYISHFDMMKAGWVIQFKYFGFSLNKSNTGFTVVGSFSGPAYFDLANQTIVPNAGPLNTYDIFVTNFSLTPSGISSSEKDNGIQVYPNPSRGFCNIKLSDFEISDIKSYSIINTLGQKLQIGTITNELTIIDLGRLASGIYTIQIESSQKTICKKVIKQ